MNLDPQITELDDQLSVWSGIATPETVETVAMMFGIEDQHRSRALLNWQYLEHLGGAFVSIAFTRQGLKRGAAGMYAAFPVRFRIQGRSILAYQSFDTLTLTEHRGQGLFVRLAELTYRKIASAGPSLVYGIPNGESFGGFARRLDWTPLDPFPLLVRPVGSRYFRVRAKLRKPRIMQNSLSGETMCTQVSELPDDFDELYARSSYAHRDGVIRDHSYLSWRLRRPGSTYRLLQSRDGHGTLKALVITELVIKHGCAVGYIMEAITDSSNPAVARDTLSAAVVDLKRGGADVILGWAMPDDPQRNLFRQAKFSPLPSYLAPIELHLGFRLFGINEPLTRRHFSLSYLDSDTV